MILSPWPMGLQSRCQIASWQLAIARSVMGAFVAEFGLQVRSLRQARGRPPVSRFTSPEGVARTLGENNLCSVFSS